MKRVIALTIAIAFGLAQPAAAVTVWCSNCSDKWTQAMERSTSLEQLRNLLKTYQEAVAQTEQQVALVRNSIQQYETLLRNTKNLPHDLLDGLKGEFRNLAVLTRDLKLQKGDFLATSQAFDLLYPGLDMVGQIIGAGQSVKGFWEKWTREADRATEATFQVTASQLKDIADNTEELDTFIGQLLDTPEGQMEAIQSGNKLSALQIDELRQLRMMVATSLQASAQAAAKAEKVGQSASEVNERLLDPSALEKQFEGYY